VADEWAFDRAMVHTTIEQRSGGDRKRFEARTMTILRRLDQGDWRVARSIGVIIQSPASISDPDT
jgi:ketosteroid isomerase-like protein